MNRMSGNHCFRMQNLDDLYLFSYDLRGRLNLYPMNYETEKRRKSERVRQASQGIQGFPHLWPIFQVLSFF